MAIENEERSPVYMLPRNYEDSFITAGGISFRSIAEGAVLAAITVPIFIFLPIRMLYRAILIAVFGGILFGFGVIGIKHCYLSEFIIKFFKFKSSSKEMIRDDDGIFDKLILESSDNSEEDDEDEENEENEENEEDAENSESSENSEDAEDSKNEKKKKKRRKNKEK